MTTLIVIISACSNRGILFTTEFTNRNIPNVYGYGMGGWYNEYA